MTVDIKVSDNEQFGIFIEKQLCNLYDIEFKSKRDNNMLVVDAHTEKLIFDDISRSLGGHKIRIVEHVGGENGKTDFILTEGKTLSLKSLSSSNKICPQVIGQSSRKRIGKHFKIDIATGEDFKQFVANNLQKVLDEYIAFTFICDTTLVYTFKKAKLYTIERTDAEPTFIECSFHLNKTVEEWNESATVLTRRDGVSHSIGEFQVHNNRNCCKFRFNIDKLVELKLVKGVNVKAQNLDSKYRVYKFQKENIPSSPRVCPDDKILNPKTNRFVKKTGKLGMRLLVETLNALTIQ